MIHTNGIEGFRKRTTFKIILFIALLLVIIACVGVSVSVSALDISFLETYSIIIDHILGIEPMGDAIVDDYIVWDVNLPRSVYAIFAGAGLAVAGVAMQSVMKNPLADPYTTGISSAACLGMSLAAVMGMTVSGYGTIGVLLNTFFFSMIPLAVIVFILPKKTSSVATLILIGVSLSYFFNAVNTVVTVSMDSETLADVYNWTVGSISRITWDALPVTALTVIVGSIALLLLSRQIDAISLGDDEAKSLGVDVDTYRIIIMVILSVIVAVIIAYSGIIGFIGLVCPHIVRMLVGGDAKTLIPLSAAAGSVFLIVSDVMCRAIDSTFLPVGVMVSFIGAPLFIWIILKSKVM